MSIAAWKIILSAIQLLINMLQTKVAGKSSIAIVIHTDAIQTRVDAEALTHMLMLAVWFKRLEADPDVIALELSDHPDHGKGPDGNMDA